MDISLENPKSLNPTINILLKPEDYQDKVEKSILSYRNKVTMNGFRKGKVPMGMVKKMYGEDPTSIIGLPLLKVIKFLKYFGYDIFKQC